MKLGSYGKTVLGTLLMVFLTVILVFYGNFGTATTGIAGVSSAILLISTILITSGTIHFPTGEAADEDEFEDGKYRIESINYETRNSYGSEMKSEDISVVAQLWSKGQECWWNKLIQYRVYKFKDPEGWEILNSAKKGDKIEIIGRKIKHLTGTNQ